MRSKLKFASYCFILVLIVAYLVVFLKSSDLEVNRKVKVFASNGDWYSTFEYGGATYAWSHAIDLLVNWDTIIPGYHNSYNSAPNGNSGEKGQVWCDALVQGGDNSHDKNYHDWFLPNYAELKVGLGSDPSPLPPWQILSCDCCESETDCHPNYQYGCWNGQAPALWTSTTCSYGQVSNGAYFFTYTNIHPGDSVLSIITCNNDEDYCCMRKSGYTGVHTCPQARCVRVVDGVVPTAKPTTEPTSTPTPTPTPVSEPTSTLTLTPTSTGQVSTPTPTTAADTCDGFCISQNYSSGTCRLFSCQDDETDVGQDPCGFFQRCCCSGAVPTLTPTLPLTLTPSTVPTATSTPGSSITLKRILEKWGTEDTEADLNNDGKVNGLDFGSRLLVW